LTLSRVVFGERWFAFPAWKGAVSPMVSVQSPSCRKEYTSNNIRNKERIIFCYGKTETKIIQLTKRIATKD
jgi:hypothetical protein